MGLFRKRWLQRVSESVATAQGRLAQTAGTEIAIHVDEASFPDDEALLEDFFVHEIYGLTAVTNALVKVTRDALGKEAVQEEIKSILLRNTATNFQDEGSKSVSLKDGELIISCAFSASSNNLYRPDELAQAIEKLL